MNLSRYNIGWKIVLSTAVVFSMATAHAQIDQTKIRQPTLETNADEHEWSVSLDGGFSFQHFYQDNSSADTWSGGMVLAIKSFTTAALPYLDAPYLSGRLGLGVTSESVKSATAITKTIQGFNASASVGLDTALLFPATLYARSCALQISPNVDYAGVNDDSAPGQKTAFTESSGWRYGVDGTVPLSFLTNYTPNIGINILDSYIFNNQLSENLISGGLTRTYASVNQLGAQFQYSFGKGWNTSTRAVWIHDISFTSAPGERAGYEDYAQFGIQFGYTFKSWLAISGGYSYVAFNTLAYTHAATLNVKIMF